MKNIFNQIISIIRKNPFTAALIVVAAICQLIVIIPSGSHYCFNGICGDFFWGVHEHDGIWHIAVAESAFNVFPPRNPILAGASLSGYNALLDYILFLFSLVGLSPLLMYFKVLPIIWFIFFTYSAIQLAKKISKKKIFTFIFLFLSYFGASFSFIIPLIKNNSIEGTASFLSMQAILTLTNVQLAFSYIILFLILALLYEKKITFRHILIICIYIFIQWGLKFYAGFISTIIVGVVFLLRWIKDKNKKYFFYLILLSVCSAISLIVNYNPFGQLSSGGAPFKYNPLALAWPLIEDPSMFYSYYWSNAKYTLLASSKISPRLIVLMTLLTIVYLVLNLGPRIIGFASLIKKSISNKRRDIDVGILVGILLSLVFPIFFVQRGVWWNTVQFLFPVLLLLNLYTAEYIAQLGNKTLKITVIIGIIIVSIPYSIDALRGYMRYPGILNISNNELQALKFLKKLPDGVVFSPIYKPNSSLNSNNSIPLFNHVDSSYVAAYTGKQSFYANYVQLELLNVDFKNRKKQIEIGDCSIVKQIDYFYFNSSQKNDRFISSCILTNQSLRRIYYLNNFSIYSKIK